MISCKINNHWVNDGIAIAIQVSLVFSFLTIFFFVYVTKIEKEEFKKQMNLVVDNIMDDVVNGMPNLLNSNSPLSKENTNILVNGIIDVMEEKITIEAKDSIQDIAKINSDVKSKAFSSLTTVLLGVVIIAVIFLILGFCIPIKQNIKEALIAVIFVGLTEFSFLTFIASKYISASPNKVKRNLGEAIQNWIAINKPGK